MKAHYDEVVKSLQKLRTKNRRKCDYIEVLDNDLVTRDSAETDIPSRVRSETL